LGRNGLHADTGCPKFTIDGQIFDEDRIDVRAKLGTVEEWTLINETGVHPFHMHQERHILGHEDQGMMKSILVEP
jgi:FtsP/CotA-like multicopper oxidase with cupredoxin domain